ncbi:YkuS family protein [Fusibacter sp. JL216-2]|uniref:YkuS family protein n=1 Tax=Fusibacter sp. JL216-2 TaxID=3071453 RepID=UPI003D32B165
MKISIQTGMTELENLLKKEGYDVVKYGDNDMDAHVAIINDVDMAYEEIEPVQCHGKMLVINADNMSPERVLEAIKKGPCKKGLDIKISIQPGMTEVEKVLKGEGFQVVTYGHNDIDANVSIINHVDMAYEEIEPVQFHGKQLVINADNMTPQMILEAIQKGLFK